VIDIAGEGSTPSRRIFARGRVWQVRRWRSTVGWAPLYPYVVVTIMRDSHAGGGMSVGRHPR